MNRARQKSANSTESGSDNIASLYDRTFTRIYNAIRYRVADAAIAEDLTAEVYERAIRSLDRYQPGEGVIEAWLFGIVHHVVSDYLRRRWLIAWVSLETLRNHSAHDPLLEEICIQHSLEEQLLRQLPKLKDRERELLGLKYAGGMTNRQIATLVGLTEQNVGAILFRAVQCLRQWMKIEPAGDFSPCAKKEVENEKG